MSTLSLFWLHDRIVRWYGDFLVLGPYAAACCDILYGERQKRENMATKRDIRPHILSSSQLAERLKISKKTLGRMIKDGRIPEPNRSPQNNWRFWTIQEALEIEHLLTEERS